MKFLSFFVLFLCSICIHAQDLVFVQFMDKPDEEYFMNNPSEMLSQAALDRREKHNIAPDFRDVPVHLAYIDQVESLELELIGVSKWLNGVFAWCTDEQVSAIENLESVSAVFSFVNEPDTDETTQKADKFLIEKTKTDPKLKTLDMDYGFTNQQIEQINLNVLLEEGFTGEGVKIAIIDNGFAGIESIEGFNYIRNNNQIKYTYDFVSKQEDVYGMGNHGTRVLSTIAGYIENEFIGTAIDADFYLFVSENNLYEMPDEEVNWILAAEKADSLGVDIINTSLGYSEFDDSRYDYSYEDMDGQTTYISRAAQIASEKGILTVISAGNEGQKSWHYISAPADAEGVLSIGAATPDSLAANFTSFGPTSDLRIKPDISALGLGAAVLTNDEIGTANGTSFSAPIIAGAMACLVQAFPNTHPEDLKNQVVSSAHLFENPDDQLGHGIPDFGMVYNQLLSVDPILAEPTLKLYPNPTSGILHIDTSKNIQHIQLISFEGKILRKYDFAEYLNMEDLPTGVYLFKLQLDNGRTIVKKVIKN